MCAECFFHVLRNKLINSQNIQCHPCVVSNTETLVWNRGTFVQNLISTGKYNVGTLIFVKTKATGIVTIPVAITGLDQISWRNKLAIFYTEIFHVQNKRLSSFLNLVPLRQYR